MIKPTPSSTWFKPFAGTQTGKKLLSLLLVIAFLTASAFPAFATAYPVAEGTYIPTIKERLPLEEMSRELAPHLRPYEEIAADMEHLLAAATADLYLHTTDEYQAMHQLLLEYAQLIDELYRVQILASVDKDMDLSNETQLDYFTQVSTESTQVREAFALLLLQLMDSPFNQLMRDLLGDDYDHFQLDPEADALFEMEELALVTQVSAYSESSVTIEVDGVPMTINDVLEAYDVLEAAIFDALYWEISEKRNALRVPLYIELINLRNAYAQSQGYEDYVDYAMTQYYGRDFSAEEMINTLRSAAEMFSELQKEMSELPFMFPLEGELALYQEADWYHPQLKTLQDLFNDTPFEALVKDSVHRNLLLINEHPHGYRGGYVISLINPGDGVIYLYNEGPAMNMLWNSYVHELGHLIADLFPAHEGTPQRSLLKPTPFYVETLETHAIGLEMLLLHHAAPLFQEEALAAVLYVLETHLRNLQDAAIAAEFEVTAHRMPAEELTVENLNRLYRHIGESYGIEFYFADTDVSLGWSDVPHYFEAPFYYPAYGLAVLASFDFLSLSDEDYEANFEQYTQVIRLGTNVPFREMLTTADIADLFEEENLLLLYDRFYAYVEHVLNENLSDEMMEDEVTENEVTNDETMNDEVIDDEILLQEAS